MPAAIDRLSIETFPEGVAFSAATAVVASAKTRNRAILETVRTLNIKLFLLFSLGPNSSELTSVGFLTIVQNKVVVLRWSCRHHTPSANPENCSRDQKSAGYGALGTISWPSTFSARESPSRNTNATITRHFF